MSKGLPQRFRLISSYEEEWELSKKMLNYLKKVSQSKKSISEKFQLLASTIQIFESKNRFLQFNYEDIIILHTKKCIGLETAINTFFKEDLEKFYNEILVFIIDEALELEKRAKEKYGCQTIPLMVSKKNMKEEYPKKLILSMLANDFFCNHKDFVGQLTQEQKKLTNLVEWNNVDWYWLYSFDSSISVNRIICFLAYFQFAKNMLEKNNQGYFDQNVTVERIVFNKSKILKDLSKCDKKFDINDISIHNSSMEEPPIPTQSIVDFANMDLQTGQIIPSGTQEEILFSIRPEMFMAMFVCQRIYSDEILIISNVPQLIEYEGYSTGFKFTKLKETIPENNINVLALDATMEEHYSTNSVAQDISKFYSACKFCSGKYKNAAISSGSWGCGAFGCDRAHKFLQQIICAKANDVKLTFSTFGKQDYGESLKELYNHVIQYCPKVSDLWKIIDNFEGYDDEEFHTYLKKIFGKEFYM